MNYRALEFSTNKETKPPADRAEALDAFVGALNLRLHCVYRIDDSLPIGKDLLLIRGPYREQYEKCQAAMKFLGEELLQNA